MFSVSGKCFSSKQGFSRLFKALPILQNARPCVSVLSRKNTTLAKVRPCGGRFTVTIITGDGVQPELMNYVQEVCRHAGVPVDWESIELNCSNSSSIEVVEQAILAVKRNGVVLKGNVETPIGPDCFSVNGLLRRRLDLYANVVHCKNIPSINSRHKDIDLVVIRENTEGEYSNLEHENVPGVVESLKIITGKKSERIARFAFDYARREGRKRVTAVHKANIMKMGDGLFLNTCAKVSEDYPELEFSDMIVDNASMQMVSNPQQFDVLVVPNLYGNILTNIAAGLVGGPGILPGYDIGNDYAIFETATRNTGKNLVGKNIANPCAMLFSAAKMLRYLGLHEHGSLIENAVLDVTCNQKILSPDVGGTSSTSDIVTAVIKFIKDNSQMYNI